MNQAIASAQTALVVEDDQRVADALFKVASSLGYDVEIAGTLAEAKQCMQKRMPSLMLVDVRLPDGNALQMLRELSEVRTTESKDGVVQPQSVKQPNNIIVITGDQTQETAIECVRLRALDLLQKPFDLEQLHRALSKVSLSMSGTGGEGAAPESVESQSQLGTSASHRLDTTLGETSASRDLKKIVSLVAATSYPSALISGASGVDKLRLAELIHILSRRGGHLQVINCAIESGTGGNRRLFGEEDPQTGEVLHRGYIEQAAAGTLVLDDVTHLSLELQARLVHLLDYGLFTRHNGIRLQRVKLSLIGIARSEVDDAVKEGSFHPDFMHRLQQFVVQVPRLGQRGEDSVVLAELMLTDLNLRTGSSRELSSASRKAIRRHTWPGNLREMRNLLVNGFEACAEGAKIELSLDDDRLASNADERVIQSYVGKSVWELERDLLLATLEFADGDKVQTAAILGVSLKTLYNRLHAYS